MSDIVLEIKALTRRFGAFTAVDALTLSVTDGNLVAVRYHQVDSLSFHLVQISPVTSLALL
jgi:hypothetical protein